MKRTSSIIVALVLAASGARAQEPPQPPATQDARPPAAAPPAPGLTREKLERIYHIRQLEAMLTNAVRAGASSLANQLQIEPNSLFVTNSARARGYELDDYGVFFDVDVPTMMPSVLWTMQMRQQQQQDLNALRKAVADPNTSEGIRRMATVELRRLERALGLPPSQLAAGTPQAAPQGMAVATTTETVVPAAGRSEMTPAPALPDPTDPNELYTDAIKSKVIDAMLNFGSALRLEDTEWLTIAVRATDAAPGQLDDSASILIRIKGADLNAFVLKKITRDEVLKKIEIKIG